MTRLLIHVEGQTEEAFVNTVLAPYLYGRGFTRIGARLLGNARNRARRGEIRDWHVVKADIERHLKTDQDAYASLMVDYYALPLSWPGRDHPIGADLGTKFRHINELIVADFENSTGIVGRFVPFILMHEFEALLFSDCAAFASAIGFEEKAASLQAIRDLFDSPEHINDSPVTAPSKRVKTIITGYDKVLFGNVAALEIGLDRMRQECPNFGTWITCLDELVP
jgi:hypothetical protein